MTKQLNDELEGTIPGNSWKCGINLEERKVSSIAYGIDYNPTSE